MPNKGLKKHFTNPILGLIPFLVYLVIYGFVGHMEYALISALLLSALCEISVRMYTKTTACGLMFGITFIAATLTLITWFFLKARVSSPNIFPVFFEMYLVCLLIITRLSEKYINRSMFTKKGVIQKMYLTEFFLAAAIVQYVFTLHIFTVLITSYINIPYTNQLASLYCIWLPVLLLILLFIYQGVRSSAIFARLKKEDWLPIVNEKGVVTGRVAKSVSLQMGNRFLHPIVRVALVCNGQIYLKPRKVDDVIDAERLDHPFEKYMLFNHEINLSVRNSIAQILGDNDLPFKFSLKYVFENESAKRLVFLFVARIEEESELNNIPLLKGKFWSTKQIDENMSDHKLFSECFQLEYEYLKNTILVAPGKAKAI